MEPKTLTRPENASSLQPTEARALFKRNGYYGTTAGFCVGYSQANLVVIPETLADDFESFCKVNSGPFPLLYRSKVGECLAPPLARDSDVKTDLPRYIVYSKGKRVEDTLDLSGFEQSWSNLVSFYLGCSYTFEGVLRANGIRLRHIEQGLNVSAFLTSIQLKPVGLVEGKMYTSMRPIKKDLLPEVFRLTAQYPQSHGPPIHIGNPARIGVKDITAPEAGDPSTVEDGEVPVFWACGFSVSQILSTAAPQLAFTHYAGSMFIADVQPQPKVADDIDIVEISREGQPFFASVLEKKSASILHNMEKSLLDDPGKGGAIHVYQTSQLLKATLALSHASRVAITTGFPVHLPAALSICQALVVLGKDVALISDSGDKSLFESCVEHARREGGLKSHVKVLSYSKAIEVWRKSSPDDPLWDCIIAIERAGQTKDTTPVSVEPHVNGIFLEALSHPLVSTIAIVDSGDMITPVDFLIASAVSSWAGHALALGLYVVSSSPIHWRYRNHGINADQAPQLDRADFLPTTSQIGSLMNKVGISDGVNGGRDQSVDDLPLQCHLDKVTELMNLLN